MIDSDLDPDFLLEYFENEFAGFDFLDPPIPETNEPQTNAPNNNANREDIQRNNLPLFRGLHSRRNPERRTIVSLLEDDLTPVPGWNAQRRSNSFDSLHNPANVNNALLSPTPSIYDVKFYCGLMSVSVPKSALAEERSQRNHWLSCFGVGARHYLTLSIKIYDEVRVFKLVRNAVSPSSRGKGDRELSFSLKPMTSSPHRGQKKDRSHSRHSQSQSSSSASPELWEFADYHGSAIVELMVEKHSSFAFGASLIAKKRIPLNTFLEEQRLAEKTGSYFSKQSNFNWLQSMTIEMVAEPSSQGILRRLSGSRSSASNTATITNSVNNTASSSAGGPDWWTALTASASGNRKPRFSQPKYSSSATTNNNNNNNTSTNNTTATASAALRPIAAKSRIKLRLSFRLIFLQNCLRPSVKTSFLLPSSSPSEEPHQLNEFHVLVAKAPSSLLVEVMKSLAWRGVLAKALASPTSLGFWPVEVALRVGNAPAVQELLQRTGYLCLPPLLPRHSGPLHHCLVGNSSLCFEYLHKFLARYGGGGEGPGRAGAGRSRQQQLYENMTWDNCLEWKDEQDHTPFTLACSLPHRTALLKELLLSGASMGEVNAQSHWTGFMYACETGDVEIVETLLSIQDIPKGEQDLLDQIRYLQSQRSPLRLVSLHHLNSAALLSSTQGISSPGAGLVSPFNGEEEALARMVLGPDYHSNTPSNNNSNSSAAAANPATSFFYRYPSPLSLAQYPCLPNYQDPISGKQAIHLAAERGHEEIVVMLLRIGVSCGEVDLQGRSLYHIAVEQRLEHLLQQLILIERQKWSLYLQTTQKRGYETMMSPLRPLLIRDVSGRLPVDLAMQRGEKKMALLLIRGMLDLYRPPKTAATSPSRPSSHSNGSSPGRGGFVSLNLSAIRRQVSAPVTIAATGEEEEEEEEERDPIAMKRSVQESSTHSTNNNSSHRPTTRRKRRNENHLHCYLSEEMVSWLLSLQRQLEEGEDLYRVDFQRLQQEKEREESESEDAKEVLVTRAASPLPQRLQSSESREQSQSQSQNPSSYFSPFSLQWIGGSRGRRSRSSLSPTRGDRLREARGESKDEQLALEEKEDDLQEREEEEEERIATEEEDEKMDELEYLMALTPLSLKAYKPNLELN